MSEVIVFGGINMDLFAYVPRSTQEGETIEADSIEFYLGGKGANQAVALSRLGVKVRFVATIGSDQFGNQLENLIKKENINTSNMNRKEGKSGIALINVLKDGRNEVISFPSVNKKTLSQQVSDENLEDCSILIGQMEVEPLQTTDLFIRAKNNNCKTILNLAPFKRANNLLMENTDILIVNEIEFAELSNKKPNSIDFEFVDKTFPELDLPFGMTLVVTLGGEGVITFSHGKKQYFEGRKVKAIDTVGAGDCFVGAFGYALLNGHDIFSATNFANCASSIAVTRKGAAESMPSLGEVKSNI